ncbi:hypothetical protein [Sporomusa sp. KB1]|jgi:hypothetical protein|uniref:hypothetical protein n=1 Tax=Sporomusa sp. KB1 TaxID=943346 RepID=UPI00119DBB33|nr:hypothetical protein [Sporomusa sp. KB1]TWH46060.1 hypothetical protein Salpa_2006 [Sporomusa sp. KB1]
MEIKSRQIELAQSVPAIIGILAAKRQALVERAGMEVAAMVAKAGLTIREQQAAMAVADLYLRFCQEDENNQKWSELMEDAIRRDDTR